MNGFFEILAEEMAVHESTVIADFASHRTPINNPLAANYNDEQSQSEIRLRAP